MSNSGNSRIYVSFWGTRGSISTPGSRTEKYGGNTPCVSIEYEDTVIVLDAGTGIRNLGLEMAKEIKKKKRTIYILLSHTHWDHIQGLPFFAPAYMKNVNLAIYGSPQKEVLLESILQGQMDVNYFPVDMNAFEANISISEISKNKIKLGPITVDCQEQVCHPGGSVRYRMTAGNKTIVYATDVELDLIYTKRRTKDSVKLAKEYESFISNADLLIADAQYTKEEYPDKKGWGHSSVSNVVKIATKSKVKQLAMFHHDPQHSDTALDDLYRKFTPVVAKSKHDMNLFWAREGMTLAI